MEILKNIYLNNFLVWYFFAWTGLCFIMLFGFHQMVSVSFWVIMFDVEQTGSILVFRQY